MENWEQYQKAYQAADEATKSKLHSSLIPECVALTVKKQQLDDNHQKTLVQLFSEKLLGLTNEEQMKQTMRTAGVPNAEVVLQEITTCLSSHTASIADTSLIEEAAPTEKATEAPADTTPSTPQSVPVNPEVASEPKPTPAQTPESERTNANDLASEIEKAEAEFDAIPKIKTMAQDAQDVTEHSSNQDSLLQRPK